MECLVCSEKEDTRLDNSSIYYNTVTDILAVAMFPE